MCRQDARSHPHKSTERVKSKDSGKIRGATDEGTFHSVICRQAERTTPRKSTKGAANVDPSTERTVEVRMSEAAKSKARSKRRPERGREVIDLDSVASKATENSLVKAEHAERCGDERLVRQILEVEHHTCAHLPRPRPVQVGLRR